MLTKYILLC